MNASWYINRLKTMKPEELFFRVNQLLIRRWDKRFNQEWVPKKVQYQCPKPEKVFSWSDDYFSSVDDKMTEWELLGIEWDYTNEINWHLDIRSHKEFPKIFCRDVNTRSEDFRIAKYAWEHNRMLFLTRICSQYRKTRDREKLKLFMRIINSWRDQNPYLIGVNWYSNIEVNIRLINWFLCWEILDVNEILAKDQEFKRFVDDTWLPLIYMHCKYCVRYPSRFSSANNHLLAEHAGLFVASHYWRFKESVKWREDSRKGLERDMREQIRPDGINKEETSEYHQFIADYFLISWVVANKSKEPLSQTYRERLIRMMGYTETLMNSEGVINHYGDADEGRVFILDQNSEGRNNFSSLCQTRYIMTSRTSPTRFVDIYPDFKNSLLFEIPMTKPLFKQADEEYRTSHHYKDSGHYFFRKEEKDKEVFMHFNSAPLGYLAIAAHGHSDALGFNLSIDGKYFIVDPGTFSYHTDMDWRSYFVSSKAHNTIRVNDKDQALRAGPTMWRNHYNCNFIPQESELPNIVCAQLITNGEQVYKHKRKISFSDQLQGEVFTISDRLSGLAGKSVFGYLHAHPDVDVVLEGGLLEFTHPEVNAKLRIQLPEHVDSQLYAGSENPILGWYSDAFYHRVQATSVEFGLPSVKSSIDWSMKIFIDR